METSSEGNDDDSTLTTQSKPLMQAPKLLAQIQGHMTALDTGDIILLSGSKEASGGTPKPTEAHAHVDLTGEVSQGATTVPLPKEPRFLNWIIICHFSLERLFT